MVDVFLKKKLAFFLLKQLVDPSALLVLYL